MKAINELSVYLANVRDELGLFPIQEAASACKVTEMTIRNFEAGKTVNPIVLLYYLDKVQEAYAQGLTFASGTTYEELLATEPQEVSYWMNYYTQKTLNDHMKAIFSKGE